MNTPDTPTVLPVFGVVRTRYDRTQHFYRVRSFDIAHIMLQLDILITVKGCLIGLQANRVFVMTPD
jgi:hypothetical protein